MHSEDRIIHFSVELIHAPVQHQVAALRDFYYELSKTRAAYDSSDFSTPAQFKFYSKRGASTQSIVVFLPDRMVLVEEWADIAMSDFNDKVREVGARALKAFGLPCFLAQTATLRSTFVLTNFTDARVFLMDHMCQQADRIGPHFRRPISVGGLRFVLPETPDFPGNLHVLIESFKNSINEVFVEVKGIFLNQRIDAEGMESAVENIKLVRSFISNNVYAYLEQFDQANEE